MQSTKQQQAVLNTPAAMATIILEAKKTVAKKAGTTVAMVDLAISQKNQVVLSQVCQLVEAGVKQAANAA